jgi:hypothetical protein
MAQHCHSNGRFVHLGEDLVGLGLSRRCKWNHSPQWKPEGSLSIQEAVGAGLNALPFAVGSQLDAVLPGVLETLADQSTLAEHAYDRRGQIIAVRRSAPPDVPWHGHR